MHARRLGSKLGAACVAGHVHVPSVGADQHRRQAVEGRRCLVDAVVRGLHAARPGRRRGAARREHVDQHAADHGEAGGILEQVVPEPLGRDGREFRAAALARRLAPRAARGAEGARAVSMPLSSAQGRINMTHLRVDSGGPGRKS